MNLVRLGLAGERGKLPLGRTAPDDEEAAETFVQVREALEHELRARAGGVAPGEEAIVEAEDGHDLLRTLQGGAQGGVVLEAKVAREPDEGGHAGCTRDAPEGGHAVRMHAAARRRRGAPLRPPRPPAAPRSAGGRPPASP